MRDEHLSTTLETKSDKIIKSSVKNLVPIPNHSEILSDSNDDDTSSDDNAFEDIKFVEASVPNSELFSLKEVNDVDQEEKKIDLEDILQIQDVILREKLLSINRLIANIEFLNDNPTPDHMLKCSTSFPIPVADSDSFFEKSGTPLSYLDNSLPEFENFGDHTVETRSGSTTTHANNSLPNMIRFVLRLSPIREDNLIPSGIENIDHDSEGDIYFLEELLSNDSIPLLKNKSSNFDHHNDPSFPRPPSKLPDVEVFFEFEPDSGELISAVMKNIDELNEDECFDPGGGEIDVFANVEDDDYFPFIFVI
uniref:Uncharacterized protein n=1 Tax=Tanacetum cinerariifolium TaxID=118510 RepID=A0A699J367_TANCI|nr:hypothetical protein [Tanacetum cinerariifolium]